MGTCMPQGPYSGVSKPLRIQCPAWVDRMWGQLSAWCYTGTSTTGGREASCSHCATVEGGT